MSSIELIRSFQALGCKDNVQCAVASMIYLDLKDDPTVNDVEHFYDVQLDLIYFRTLRVNGESNVIVPTSACTDIDINRVEGIQRKLNGESKRITLAICDPSSTILYYTVTNDFVEK